MSTCSACQAPELIAAVNIVNAKWQMFHVYSGSEQLLKFTNVGIWWDTTGQLNNIKNPLRFWFL